jgi:hypothetical protein
MVMCIIFGLAGLLGIGAAVFCYKRLEEVEEKIKKNEEYIESLEKTEQTLREQVRDLTEESLELKKKNEALSVKLALAGYYDIWYLTGSEYNQETHSPELRKFYSKGEPFYDPDKNGFWICTRENKIVFLWGNKYQNLQLVYKLNAPSLEMMWDEYLQSKLAQ